MSAGNRRALCLVAVAALGLAAGHGSARAEAVLGAAPGYTTRALGVTGEDKVPNADAMDRRIWAPALDDGFVPQGLTFTDGAVYLGAYRSAERGQGRGPCRLFRVDPDRGTVTASLDLPPSCGHAGGIAKGAAHRLWVADTHVLIEVALTPAAPGLGRVLREVALELPLKGSFAAGDGEAIWLGGYERDTPGRLYRVPLSALSGASVGAQQATTTVSLPSRAQGAAFDRQGRLWISRSGAAFGELLHIDVATGSIGRPHAMPAGIEDLSFDPSGRVWSVSEAGSRRWSGWATHFPVLFRLDPAKLR